MYFATSKSLGHVTMPISNHRLNENENARNVNVEDLNSLYPYVPSAPCSILPSVKILLLAYRVAGRRARNYAPYGVMNSFAIR